MNALQTLGTLGSIASLGAFFVAPYGALVALLVFLLIFAIGRMQRSAG